LQGSPKFCQQLGDRNSIGMSNEFHFTWPSTVDFQRFWVRINKLPVSLTAWTLPAVHFLALFFFLDGDDRLGSRLKSALWYRIAAQIREAVGAFLNLLECPLDIT